jgi:rRNA biogenesis protein RRP5
MKMTRKFAQTQDVWVRYAIFHHKNSNHELAQKLLIKSLNSIDKKDHVEMVNKFAQLEFKYGDCERGKSMFDSLLFTYPNRTDIWSVYIDMLVKHNLISDARFIFDRIIKMGLTAKRMKFIFKKFMEFETEHGTSDAVERVKEMAIQYVENNNSVDDSKSNTKNNKRAEINLKKSLKI